SIREGLKTILSDRYHLVMACDGVEGLKLAIKNAPDLILLDVMMPRMDGFLTCEALRQEETTRDVPIIMVTALRSTQERIHAFKVGADDYVSKPFDSEELLTRIEAKLQRFQMLRMESQSSQTSQMKSLVCGNLRLNADTQEASIDGETIHLSALEFKLVSYLVERKGRLCRREDILADVWHSKELSVRILDPHILTIRRKLDGFNHVIRSVYGGGYILKPVQEQARERSDSVSVERL
ncbi:MAG: response regulator transcription factor, partial [Bdellovibrionia bacterium]